MDLQQYRTWADVMDKAAVISLIVAGLAVAAVGVATWLSNQYRGTARAVEAAATLRLPPPPASSAQDLAKAVLNAQEQSAKIYDRAATLDSQLSSAKLRIAQLEQTIAEADRMVDQAMKRAVESERMLETANARVTALEKELADVRARQAQRPKLSASFGFAETGEDTAAHLKKFAGSNAAVYALEEAPDAAKVASSIKEVLAEAGWTSSVWNWKGVTGISGIVVLTKEGKDPTTDEAAAGLVNELRAARFNVLKANWPGDWRRHQGSLFGPEKPDPTAAPIRIVVGANSH